MLCLYDILVAFRVFFFDFQKNVNFELCRFAILVDVLDDFDGNRLTISATKQYGLLFHMIDMKSKDVMTISLSARYIAVSIKTFTEQC